MTIWSS